MSASRIIVKGAHYTACLMRDGSLIVTSNRHRKGVRVVGLEASLWAQHIETATDAQEAHALCRGVMSALH